MYSYYTARAEAKNNFDVYSGNAFLGTYIILYNGSVYSVCDTNLKR